MACIVISDDRSLKLYEEILPVKQNIWITLVQSWTNVEDVVQMLYKCFVFAGLDE